MKLIPALLLAAVAAPALAQTKPPVRHTPVRKPAAQTSTGACGTQDVQPALPIAVPKVAGCTKPLYALRYIDTTVGTGAAAAPRKWLTVAYTGYLTDGTKFDSSIGKDPITFPYGAHQVIAGWDTGFEGMNIGGKRRLFIPYELAYGEAGRPPVIPAKAELIFDIELVSISDTPPAPKTPPTPPAGSTPPAPKPPVPAPGTPPAGTPPAGTTPPGTTPPSATPPVGTPPGAQGTVGKPTTSPAPDPAKPSAPTDPTQPASVPPPSATPKR